MFLFPLPIFEQKAFCSLSILGTAAQPFKTTFVSFCSRRGEERKVKIFPVTLWLDMLFFGKDVRLLLGLSPPPLPSLTLIKQVVSPLGRTK